MHFVDAKGILTAGGGGLTGMNIYRGCTHGCVYCDSRSRCYGFTRAFEDVEVKRNAPELLENALRSKRRRCVIGTGSMSDPYMPCERGLGLTRRCLEILLAHGFGAAVLTKSDLVLRDLDLLADIHREAKSAVQLTITSCDDALCRLLEPNVCPTSRRLEVLHRLRERGIPTFVWLSPVLPFLTDTEENVAAILSACAGAGVMGVVDFGMGLTLREGDREYYYAALDRHFPGLRERYIRRYGEAYLLPSPRAKELTALFRSICAEKGMLSTPEECFAYMRALPEKHTQLSLW